MHGSDLPRLGGWANQPRQGESDAADAGLQYAANFAHFIARVRERFQTPDLVFVYGYVCPPPGKLAGCDAIRQAQHDLDQNSGSPLAVIDAFAVKTGDLSQRAGDPGTPPPGRRFADRIHEALRETLR